MTLGRRGLVAFGKKTCSIFDMQVLGIREFIGGELPPRKPNRCPGPTCGGDA
jgi:hypothetical protein